MKEEENIEIRSEAFQEVLGDTPHWILRWGIIILSAALLLLLTGSFLFKYPDTISAEMTLTGLNPSISMLAKTNGKLQELHVKDQDFVIRGEYLAVIENPAKTEDMACLKAYLTDLNSDTILSLPPKDLRLGSIQSLYSAFYIALREYLDFTTLQYYPQKKEVLLNKIAKREILAGKLLKQKDIVKEQTQIIHNQHNRNTTLYQKGVIAYEIGK